MKKLFLFLFISFGLTAFSQKQGNTWYFADSVGLDFSSGSPVVLVNGSLWSPAGNTTEGTTTISDSAGNLLFYANAEQAWNRNHQVMSNGSGLMGGASSTQGALILPLPGSDSLFFLFTTDQFQNNLQNGLRYSMVNMCLDNGNGDIIPAQKNILLLDSAGEKLAATNHANGTDYWLVSHQFFTDAFYAYHISPGGITDTVVSHIGSVHIDWNQPTNCGPAIGQMKISPDGSKLALAWSNSSPCGTELFDFNNATGVVSNFVSLPPDPGEYGVAFSPDNSKLYFSTLGVHTVVQYNLAAGNTAAIIASKVLIANNNSAPLCGMQLGPDGKIYIAATGYLDVISNPDGVGNSCAYMYNAIYLNGRNAAYGITNFVDSYVYTNNVAECSTPKGIEDQNARPPLALAPNPFTGTATLQLYTSGEYTFSLFNGSGQTVKTISGQGSLVTIDRADLAPGIYYWTVTVDKEMAGMGKVVVEK